MKSPRKLTSFTLFPGLPTEIRLKIWRLIAPGPRTVLVQYSTKCKISAFTGWTSPYPPPVILAICQESRLEALKSYQLAFGSYFHPAKIYIDFSIDTLRFENAPKEWEPFWDPNEQHYSERTLTASRSREVGPSDYLLDILLGGGYHGVDDTEKIQHMIIDVSEVLYGRKNFCWDEIRLFTALKELTLFAWDVDEVADEMMAHYRETLNRVARAHPEWIIPQIRVKSAPTGTEWGAVTALGS